MERLTEKEPNWIDDELYMSACEPDDETVDAIYMKLKAYEDTGLEPAEVMEYKKFKDALVQKYNKPLKDILDLLEKQKQGRLIELPCKVGDTFETESILPTMTGKGYRSETVKCTLRDVYLSDTRNRHHEISDCKTIIK